MYLTENVTESELREALNIPPSFPLDGATIIAGSSLTLLHPDRVTPEVQDIDVFCKEEEFNRGIAWAKIMGWGIEEVEGSKGRVVNLKNPDGRDIQLVHWWGPKFDCLSVIKSFDFVHSSAGWEKDVAHYHEQWFTMGMVLKLIMPFTGNLKCVFKRIEKFVNKGMTFQEGTMADFLATTIQRRDELCTDLKPLAKKYLLTEGRVANWNAYHGLEQAEEQPAVEVQVV